MAMNILSIIGARPQFIKAAPVSRAVREIARETLLHTGQHYDREMSQIFFDELHIPKPDYNLGIGSGSHGWQTSQMLIHIEEVLQQEQPDWVLVYGDTNSTLAGALAAVKLHIPVAHVEAGLRSFNRAMPEEHNRVLTDHAADLLFCPTQNAVDLLTREGVTTGVHLTGDVMYDAYLYNVKLAEQRSTILAKLDLAPKTYALATVHRPANTDDPDRLRGILDALAALETSVILPAHPRTRQAMERIAYRPSGSLRILDPVGYLDMLMLEQHATRIFTDSGGVQKEAYFASVPCITLREDTEWTETLEAGWNTLVGAEPARILDAARNFYPPAKQPPLYGDGQASEQIAAILQTQAS